MSKVYRVFVEKRKEYRVEAQEVLNNLKSQLNISGLKDLSIVHRYDVQGISEDVLKEGDECLVKVIEITNDGKINLSRKDMLPKPEVKE